MTPHSTITSKGQTTIPVDIRMFLGVKPGDELEYIKTASGSVEVRPRKHYTWRDIKEILPKPKKVLSDAEIKASIETFWTRKGPKEMPKMMGLDTNILIRLFTRDEPARVKVIDRFLEKMSAAKIPCHISEITLCETLWVLRTAYGYSKRQLAGAVRMLIESDDFIVENAPATTKALTLFEQKNVGFADILIGLRNQKAGCDTTFTLDKAAAKLDAFTLLT